MTHFEEQDQSTESENDDTSSYGCSYDFTRRIRIRSRGRTATLGCAGGQTWVGTLGERGHLGESCECENAYVVRSPHLGSLIVGCPSIG